MGIESLVDASMGPRSLSVEDAILARVDFRPPRRFNGATLFERGRLVLLWSRSSFLIGFNGATLFERGRRPLQVKRRGERTASMGPRSLSVEDLEVAEPA